MARQSFVPYFFLFPFICASQTVKFIDNRNESNLNQLCDMGCKCPEKGKTSMLLDCSEKGIAHLPSSLQFESSFIKLNFESNFLTSLNMSTFSIADSIEELDFHKNSIIRVENSTFLAFRSLMSLRMGRNYLDEVSPGLLDGLSNLKVLDLSHNKIQRLSPVAFKATPKLLELRLEYNPIFELHENLFQFLPSLERLDLEDTGLVRLPCEIFRPLPRLLWLSLSNNAFENVPEEALCHATALTSLNLSGNDFTRIEPGNFRRLSNISSLYMNAMPKLMEIDKNAFAGMTKLSVLSLSYNPLLWYIDPEAFGSRNSTILRTAPREQLHLRQNALRTLKSPLTHAMWSHMHFVDLSENPWKCDCDLLWMQELKPEAKEHIVCSSPPHLKGRSLSSIDGAELTCSNKWSLVTFYVIISATVCFAIILLGASAMVCSRTPPALYIRAKKQFSYSKVDPKTETVDLEWDPSADT